MRTPSLPVSQVRDGPGPSPVRATVGRVTQVSTAVHSLRRAAVSGLALVLGAALLAAPGLTGASPASAAGASDDLPFDMPSVATLRASGKPVVAHYVPWQPVSIDNVEASKDYYTRHWLSPDGENGKYRAYGGRQRDRPVPRDPRTGADWRLADLRDEVRRAIDAGLDGFAVSIVSLSGANWETTKALLTAAHQVDPGFRVMLRPNMISLASKPRAELAARLAELAAYPAVWRTNGALFLTPFYAEKLTVDQWREVLALLADGHGEPVFFWPQFMDEQKYRVAFDPISHGMAHWGDRNPARNDPAATTSTSKKGRVAALRTLGQRWMQPVSFQDVRPAQAIYDEPEGLRNLRLTWQLGIETDADVAQLVTWNDYPEGTQVTPSGKHDRSILDVSAYYLTWFKTGVAPRVTRDAVYVSHRTQAVSAQPTYDQTTLMKHRGGTPPRDAVEALTFLTAPARVVVQVGSKAYVCENAAGLDTCTVPLGTGEVSARVLRDGETVAGTTSRRRVTATPYVQDLDHVVTSSLRTPTDGRNDVAVSSTTAVPKVREVAPSADAYVNAGAPSTVYGRSSSLSVRGSTAAASYLRFTVPATPARTRVTDVVLRLRTASGDSSPSGDRVSVRFASGDWSESTLTWKNRPAPVGDVLGTFTGPVASAEVRADLDTGAFAARDGETVELVLTATGADEWRGWSREFTTYTQRPALLVVQTPVL